MKADKGVSPFLVLLVSLAASFLSLLCWKGGVLTHAEYLSWDARMRLVAAPGERGDDIAIIAVDQDSLDWLQEEPKLTWPAPREIYRYITDFCTRAGCVGLAFDLLFTESSSYGAEDDALFGSALGRNGKAVVAACFDEEGQFESLPAWAHVPPVQLEGTPPGGLPEAHRAILPVPGIAANAMLGNVSVPPDSDGVHRRVSLFSSFSGKLIPEFALALFLSSMEGGRAQGNASQWRLSGTAPDWERRIPLDADGKAVITFRGNKGSFLFLSAATVIRSELRILEGKEPFIAPEGLKGKYVLVGVTAPGLFDRARTPMDSFFSGVEVQATILDNILNNSFIAPAPLGVFGLLLFLLPLLAAAGLRQCSTVPAQGAVWFAGLLSPPCIALALAHQGVWLPMVSLNMACALALLGTGACAYALRVRQKRHIEKAFKHYLAPPVVQRIIDNGLDLGMEGKPATVSIFFSDIRGFSTLAQDLEPGQVVSMLNSYFKPVTETIVDHGGTLDKFVGDALMAFWNEPEPVDNHERKAVAAALKIQAALDALNLDLQKVYGLQLETGVGLHVGKVHLGNMGTEKLMDYTIIGDNVNIAARLEGLCRIYAVPLIVSGEVALACGEDFLFQRLGKRRVKGRDQPVDIYTAHALAQPREFMEELEQWHQALDSFENGAFHEAEQRLSRLYAKEERGLYQYFLGLCGGYRQNPPGNGWDGVL